MWLTPKLNDEYDCQTWKRSSPEIKIKPVPQSSLRNDKKCLRSLLIYEAARGNLMYNVSKHRREKKQVEKDADDKEKTEKTEKEKTNRLFVEEGATKYFRRLDFTPDGAFLITPGLIYKSFLSSIFLPTLQKPDAHVRWVFC